MKVNIGHLIPGCVLSEDVYKKTTAPIMKKKTVLTEEHIMILKVFLVSTVSVEQKLNEGSIYKPNEIIKEEVNTITKQESTNELPFKDLYVNAVQQYKKLFTHWKGGRKVDAFMTRKVFLPLYDKQPTKVELMEINRYSTENDYIYYHSVAVSLLSSSIGKKMGLSNGEVIQLGLAGLLSDCGMSKIPITVFEKKSSLNVDEFEEVKQHPILGYRMLEGISGFSNGALLGVLQHHERENGSGYPMGLKSDKLHLYAKIISICDIYHAMTSERYYRTKQSPFKVIESLYKDHFGKVDHIILNTFVSVMIDLSIGKKVRLSNGNEGEVIFIEESDITRPLIKLNGTNEILKLTSYPDIHIEEVI